MLVLAGGKEAVRLVKVPDVAFYYANLDVIVKLPPLTGGGNIGGAARRC